MAKIKDSRLSILRISYSTLFAIFSFSAIAMSKLVESSSFVINIAFGLFEQTTDFKSNTPVVLLAR